MHMVDGLEDEGQDAIDMFSWFVCVDANDLGGLLE
jgi:hypothetical protein